MPPAASPLASIKLAAPGGMPDMLRARTSFWVVFLLVTTLACTGQATDVFNATPSSFRPVGEVTITVLEPPMPQRDFLTQGLDALEPLIRFFKNFWGAPDEQASSVSIA
jgi:hypothetical protein